jgi:hypothetical protein
MSASPRATGGALARGSGRAASRQRAAEAGRFANGDGAHSGHEAGSVVVKPGAGKGTPMRAQLLSVAVAFTLALPAAAAEPYRAPRNAVGQPDLAGIWSYNYLSRLERADIYPSVVISEAQARSIRPLPLIAPDAVGQDASETYDEGLALARVGGEIRTAYIVDPPDGRLPYTPEGRVRASKPPTFEGPEPRTNQERCLIMPSTGPPMTSGLYNNNLEILQTRDHLVIFLEQNHEARIVPIGRRPHGAAPRWMGDTVGWWEGDSFVMETTNFAPGSGSRSYPLGRLYVSPDAVVTERLRRISPTQVLYSYTVTDPANYTRPWKGEMPLNVGGGPMYEYACHEGNYSLPNILAGARAEDRAAAAAGR